MNPLQKNIRIERNFGEEYSPYNIMERIKKTKPMAIYVPYKIIKDKTYNSNTHIKSKKKVKGLIALYYYYCYLLKIFPTKTTIQKLSPEMRAEIKKLDEYSREIRFVCRNKLETRKDLQEYKEKAQSELHSVILKRDNLYRKHKKAQSLEEREHITEQISSFTKELDILCYDIRTCENIEKKTPEMQRNLNEMETSEINVKNKNKSRYDR